MFNKIVFVDEYKLFTEVEGVSGEDFPSGQLE